MSIPPLWLLPRCNHRERIVSESRHLQFKMSTSRDKNHLGKVTFFLQDVKLSNTLEFDKWVRFRFFSGMVAFLVPSPSKFKKATIPSSLFWNAKLVFYFRRYWYSKVEDASLQNTTSTSLKYWVASKIITSWDIIHLVVLSMLNCSHVGSILFVVVVGM